MGDLKTFSARARVARSSSSALLFAVCPARAWSSTSMGACDSSGVYDEACGVFRVGSSMFLIICFEIVMASRVSVSCASRALCDFPIRRPTSGRCIQKTELPGRNPELFKSSGRPLFIKGKAELLKSSVFL